MITRQLTWINKILDLIQADEKLEPSILDKIDLKECNIYAQVKILEAEVVIKNAWNKHEDERSELRDYFSLKRLYLWPGLRTDMNYFYQVEGSFYSAKRMLLEE